jgi:H+/Cl- antiporter ClcA
MADLSVGKEGPLIHISMAIADNVMLLPCFREFKSDATQWLSILGCACVAGVAATFGTPFGALLFSIEVTAEAYRIRDLPRGLFCGLCAVFIFYSVGLDGASELFAQGIPVTAVDVQLEINRKHTRSSHSIAALTDLILVAILGCFSGILGSAFVAVVSHVARLRNEFFDGTFEVVHGAMSLPSSHRRDSNMSDSTDSDQGSAHWSLSQPGDSISAKCYAIFVTGPWFHLLSFLRALNVPTTTPTSRKVVFTIVFVFVVAVLAFFERSIGMASDKDGIHRINDRIYYEHSNVWSWALALYIPYKAVVTAMSVLLPLPVGLFTPIFALGGVMVSFCPDIILQMQVLNCVELVSLLQFFLNFSIFQFFNPLSSSSSSYLNLLIGCI